ncbi:MAG TPA: hypothetical protein DEB09_04565 [Candidatus Magasanikbacteria bacterium]|nr:hypothetical protein [Candidatus Magasanikbacteria bacterium]
MPVFVSAFDFESGLNKTAQGTGIRGMEAPEDVPTLLGTIIGSGLAIVGVVFFGIMIYGGFKWMVARGNEENAKKGIDAVFGAIIGIVIVFSAYAVTNFLVSGVKDEKIVGGQPNACRCNDGNGCYNFNFRDIKIEEDEAIKDCRAKCNGTPIGFFVGRTCQDICSGWQKEGDPCVFET